MTRQQISYEGLLQTSIALGATTPVPAGNPIVWSTTALQALVWNGSSWTGAAPQDVVYPTAMTTTAITAAANSVYSAGGGVVFLSPGTFTMTASLPLLSGVVYRGSGYVATQSGGGNPVLSGGTILQGNGTFPIFSGNATDLSSPYSPTSGLIESLIDNCGVELLGISNGTYGIKCGALYQGGCLYANFRDLFIQNCTTNAFWFENFSHCNFERIQVYNNLQGGQWMASGTSIYNFGNSHVSSLAGGASTANSSGRVWAIQARKASSLNNLSMFDMGGAGVIATSTQTGTFTAPIACTITSGSASISATNSFAANDPVYFTATVGTSGGQVVTGTPYYVSSTELSSSAFQVSATAGGSVITFNASGTPNVETCKIGITDLTKFGVGMPVTLSATANGFTGSLIYFVLTVSGTTGSGYIVLCNSLGGTSGSTPLPCTGSTAASIITKGWPVFEIGGSDQNSGVSYSCLKGATDFEVGGTAHIVVQACTGLDLELGNCHAPSSTTDVCVRSLNATQGIRISVQNVGLTTDLDSSAQDILIIGSAPTSNSAYYAGIGLCSSNTAGVRGQLSLQGAVTPDIICNSNFYNQIQMQNSLALQTTQITGSTTLTSSSGNCITCAISAAATITLPALSSVNFVGWRYEISNPTTYTVTVTSVAQSINGGGSSATSVSLGAHTNGIFVAHNSAGTMYWAYHPA